MLNVNLAKHYYVRNNRLHMSLKTGDHLKRTEFVPTSIQTSVKFKQL